MPSLLKSFAFVLLALLVLVLFYGTSYVALVTRDYGDDIEDHILFRNARPQYRIDNLDNFFAPAYLADRSLRPKYWR